MKHARRSALASVSAAMLVLGGVVLGASSATAAEENPRPGVQSPATSANGSWQSVPTVDLIAQPFIQSEDGNLVSFSVQVRDTAVGYDIGAAAIHTFEPGVGPSADPIEGGLSGSVTFQLVEGSTTVDVTFDFPERPLLAEGVHYALVIDPASAMTGDNVSFPLFTAWSNQQPEFYVWNRDNGAWQGYATAYLLFTSQLVTITEDQDVSGEGSDEESNDEGDESAPAPKSPMKPESVDTGVAA